MSIYLHYILEKIDWIASNCPSHLISKWYLRYNPSLRKDERGRFWFVLSSLVFEEPCRSKSTVTVLSNADKIWMILAKGQKIRTEILTNGQTVGELPLWWRRNSNMPSPSSSPQVFRHSTSPESRWKSSNLSTCWMFWILPIVAENCLWSRSHLLSQVGHDRITVIIKEGSLEQY